MNLEAMKKSSSKKTKGNWDLNDVSLPNSTWVNFNLRSPFGWILHSYGGEVRSEKHDAEFIAMAVNNFEKLIAVVEAAKKIRAGLDSDEHQNFYMAKPWKELDDALQALEKE